MGPVHPGPASPEPQPAGARVSCGHCSNTFLVHARTIQQHHTDTQCIIIRCNDILTESLGSGSAPSRISDGYLFLFYLWYCLTLTAQPLSQHFSGPNSLTGHWLDAPIAEKCKYFLAKIHNTFCNKSNSVISWQISQHLMSVSVNTRCTQL